MATSSSSNRHNGGGGDKRSKRTDPKKRASREAQARIWAEAKKEVLSLSVGGLAMIASSAVNQKVPKLMGVLMDPLAKRPGSDATMDRNQTTSNSSRSLVMQIVWLGALGGTASFLRTFILNSTQETIAARLRKEAFATLLVDRDLEWFQQTSVSVETDSEDESNNNTSKMGKVLENGQGADLTSKNNGNESSSSSSPSSPKSGLSTAALAVILKDDVTTVASTVTNTLANLLRSTSSVVFGAFNMFQINGQLVGLSLVVAPVVGTLAWLSRKYLKKVVAIQDEAALQSASFLEERLNHVAMVKMSNRQDDEVRRYNELQDKYLRLGKKAAMANGLSMGVMFGLSSSALCGILYAGRRAVLAGKMTSGQLTSFGTYSFMVALGSAGIIRAMTEYSKGMQCATRLYQLMGATDVDDGIKAIKSATAAEVKTFLAKPMVKETQALAMKNVTFSYRSSLSKSVLKDVSLSLSRGEVVVLVGLNGTGKSTVASLLAGLYAPQSGTIMVQNQFTSFDYLADLDRADQSLLLQVVPQQPALFDMSILDNVCYARPNATKDEVNQALQVANCQGFVSSLDGGLQYLLGRNGCRLSGGQRQRLGLARAFLAQPVFLVLDEPASSMDAEGETAVKDLLQACRSAQQGVLVITHRARMLELADRIMVLKGGRIVEEGTLKELQKRNGELVSLMPDLE